MASVATSEDLARSVLAAFDAIDVPAIGALVTDDVGMIDDAVIADEMDVHYERLGGQQLTLPCANTFRVLHGRIAEYRVYMDISPVFA